MQEENKDLRDWYRPMESQEDSDELDLFEEAGLYQLKDNEELFREYADRLAERKAKKKGQWGRTLGILGGIAVLVGLIVGTALFFSQDDKGEDDTVNDPYDYFQYFDEYKDIMDTGITGENTIPRAPTDETVKLELATSEALEPLTLQELYEQCVPSVVGISGFMKGIGYSWGTGIVMTSDGYILTNTHVLDGASSVQVTLYDGEVYEGKLVGADTISDVAVVKIEAEGLTAARFGNSDELAVGDEAIAIGNPLNEVFSGTMTQGIISGVSRDISYSGHTMTLIQTTAALNEGNSGGPLFNIYGQVVGITNMKMMTTANTTVEGIGFAIPTTTVKEMAEAILTDGAVVGRPGMGVYVYTIGAGEDYPGGLLVDSVEPKSDAYKQGIRAEDIITHIDGEAITDFDVVSDKIQSLNVGDTVDLTIWRHGQVLEKTVQLIDQNDF